MFTLMWFGCAAVNFAVGNVLVGGLCLVNAGLDAVFGDPDADGDGGE